MKSVKCKKCKNIIYNISKKDYICDRCIEEKTARKIEIKLLKQQIKFIIKKIFYNIFKKL